MVASKLAPFQGMFGMGAEKESDDRDSDDQSLTVEVNREFLGADNHTHTIWCLSELAPTRAT